MSVEAAPPAMANLFARGQSIRRLVLRLSWPVAAERLALSVLTAVDALLVGRYIGAEAVAAVGLGSLWLWLPLAGAGGAEVGTTALVARDVGAGDRAAVERSTRAALLTALLWGVLSGLAMFAAAPVLMRVIGAEPEVARLGPEFLRPAAAGMPFLVVMYAANGALRGTGDTVRPMLVLLVLNVVNLVVTFVLISGVVGIELGTAASGWGYFGAAVVGCIISLIWLAWSGRAFGNSPRTWWPGRRSLRRFIGLAGPVTIEEFQFIAAFLVYTRIIAGQGTDAVAAHTIALRLQEAALVPGFALGTAATALVGQALGMRRPDLAAGSARAARGAALVVGLAMFVVVMLTAPLLTGAFVDDPAVVDTAATLMRIFALALPMMGVGAAIAGALRGAGDVGIVLLIASACIWLVRLPVAALGVFVLGWGVPGAWMGAATEINVRGLAYSVRFRSGRWQRIRL
ncbi:MAG: MATE family efflux transporter [Dehalococcoidia bacterium]